MTNNNFDLDQTSTVYTRENGGEWKQVMVYKLIIDLLTQKYQEHKAELEIIKGEFQSEEVGYEHDRKVNTGSYGKTVAGVQRDTMRKAIAILDSHINKQTL